MRGLPEQAVHLPFHSGPWRMGMDLVTVKEAAWFEIDSRYGQELTLRRQLLATRHGEVFAATPRSDPARAEALEMITNALTTHHSDWFAHEDSQLRNHLTEEAWALDTPALDPLEVAGRLVQEDLCLIQTGDDGPVLTAAVLCFPSRWRLREKIGRPLQAVHAPVPFYGEKLARPVDRFMQHLKPGTIASRLNWSVLDDPTLFQPEGKWRLTSEADITAANAGERLFLRVERQTLRRLPSTNAVLFGIRVHVYPLTQAAAAPAVAAELAEAVRALPSEILHYKSMVPFREAMLAWLDARR